MPVIIQLSTVDKKISTTARSTGSLNTIIGLLQHIPAPELLVGLLTLIHALSHADTNRVFLHKRGLLPLLLDLQRANVQHGRLAMHVTKAVVHNILNLCHVDKINSAFIHAGGVGLCVNLLQTQCSVDLTRLVLDLLKRTIQKDEGKQHLQSLGGMQFIAETVIEVNGSRQPDQLLDVVICLFHFFGITQLPISAEEVKWQPPVATDTCEDLEPIISAPLSNQCEEDWVVDDAEDDILLPFLSQFSPELDPGACSSDLGQRNISTPAHVRAFLAPKPSPSCSTSIDFVPEDIEPFYNPRPGLLSDVIMLQLQRILHPESLLNLVVYDDIPRGDAQESIPNSLIFSSHFESGNLKRAIQVFENEYDLILNTDINSSHYAQWFYFSVENAQPEVIYQFNVINMEKPSSLFNEGQRPLIFSEKEFTKNGQGWVRVGHDIIYLRNPFQRQQRRRKRGRPRDPTSYYTLHFTVQFPHANDRCYLAYAHPYTYTDLQNYLRSLPESHANISQYCTTQVLTRTLNDNNCYLLTITDLVSGTVPISERQICFVSSRVHPGEPSASWMCKGLIDFLLDNNNEQSKYLRQHFVWKIVPMLNPDGVVNGNYRCSLAGRDLNREWVRPDRFRCPTIWHLKQYMRHVRKEGRDTLMYCDFHGHSRRKEIFMYGCPGKKAGTGIERVFPKLLAELVPFFSYDYCSFKVQKSKESTGRVVVWRQLGIKLSYTLEASLCGGTGVDFLPEHLYRQPPEEGSVANSACGHFNTAHLSTMGRAFAQAVFNFSLMYSAEAASLGSPLEPEPEIQRPETTGTTKRQAVPTPKLPQPRRRSAQTCGLHERRKSTELVQSLERRKPVVSTSARVRPAVSSVHVAAPATIADETPESDEEPDPVEEEEEEEEEEPEDDEDDEDSS
eukprot:TRINITY_DN2692_c0_g1_i1.p1 TRINITY_DN2692_c0_g1~~TRINITY_DN2692_c0_g1_i1.p1  ORF type:complete len:1037 (-),score=130.16 TRINITY_DN2692_c0_g1_i1:1003-3705(-)